MLCQQQMHDVTVAWTRVAVEVGEMVEKSWQLREEWKSPDFNFHFQGGEERDNYWR